MKYIVEITETLQRQVEVEASNEEEACDIVSEQYRNCEIVLDAEDFIEKEINVIKKEN